jgi:hypothetical protein
MNTNSLTPVEKIEYYLGKDSLPNLHWKPELPKMWAISARQNTYIHQQKEHIANQTVTDPVTQTKYKFNNLGYRSDFDYTDDLKNKKVVLMLGCSDTFGRFVDCDKTYSAVLQQRMGKDYVVCNMGVPGGSPDQSVRIGTQMITYLASSVTHCSLFWPGFSLREFVSKTFSAGTYVADKESVPYTDWWDHIDWVSNNYNYQKNRLLIESVCRANGTVYSDLIVNRDDTRVPFDFMENGTETVFGEQSHQAIAEYFYKKFTDQPSLFQTTQS